VLCNAFAILVGGGKILMVWSFGLPFSLLESTLKSSPQSTSWGKAMAGKAQLLNSLVTSSVLTTQQAGEAVDSFLQEVVARLKRGERVELPGFGSFSVMQRDPRSGRNPVTGEEIQIPADTKVIFRPSTDLKEKLSRKAGTTPLGS
jgi:DNA-binding protein HU-beta